MDLFTVSDAMVELDGVGASSKESVLWCESGDSVEGLSRVRRASSSFLCCSHSHCHISTTSLRLNDFVLARVAS